jgi:hypothetical protein
MELLKSQNLMPDKELIAKLEAEVLKLNAEKEALERECSILNAQLEIKDRHLNIILENSSLALSAFGPDGAMELNTGKGLDVPKTNASAYKSAFIGYSLEQLEAVMPHVIQAIRVSFKERIITRAQTLTPSGKIFHAIFVPYINKADEVEYVYGIAMRWPDPSEIDEKHFYKGYLNLPPLP